jgi:hypothetical protein
MPSELECPGFELAKSEELMRTADRSRAAAPSSSLTAKRASCSFRSGPRISRSSRDAVTRVASICAARSTNTGSRPAWAAADFISANVNPFDEKSGRSRRLASSAAVRRMSANSRCCKPVGHRPLHAPLLHTVEGTSSAFLYGSCGTLGKPSDRETVGYRVPSGL